MAASSPRPDYWSRWFFRLVQIAGLALGLHEGLGKGRASVLLFSAALILGAIGVRALVRGAAELVNSTAQEQDRDEGR